MNKKQKGLSPLIATILLVVVAVILITIVLNWGKSFTNEGLNKADDVIDDSCNGVLSITECKINSDNNIIFYVKNISSTYIFSGDDFKVTMKDENGGFDSEVSATPAIADLALGQTKQVEMDPTNANGDFVDVIIKSNVCPKVFAKYNRCHR